MPAWTGTIPTVEAPEQRSGFVACSALAYPFQFAFEAATFKFVELTHIQTRTQRDEPQLSLEGAPLRTPTLNCRDVEDQQQTRTR